MKIKKHIPNFITLGNLLSGTIATILAIKGDFYGTSIMVTLGIFLDFLDGFIARILKVQGELGKQLDSLADVVTSGVVPGIVMLQLIVNAIDVDPVGYFGIDAYGRSGNNLPYLGLILTLSAGYRLAKFNLDKRQSDSFIGLPTPAMSLFIISLPLVIEYSDFNILKSFILNKYTLIVITIVFSILMHVDLPLFSLKFKSFSLKDNIVKYLFLISSLILIVIFKVVSIPLIIILYILLSILKNQFKIPIK